MPRAKRKSPPAYVAGAQPINQQPRHVVPTRLLAEEIQQHTKRLNREYTQVIDRPHHVNGHAYNDNGGLQENDCGWKTLLALRMELYLNTAKPESLPKRIWSVETCEYPTVRVAIADAMLLGCGVRLEDTTIPTLPWALPAAQISVEAWCEQMRPNAKKRLATSLLHFSQGFVYDQELTAAAAICGFIQQLSVTVDIPEAIAA